jgi:hypothetical protein
VEVLFTVDPDADKGRVCPPPAPRRDLPPTGLSGRNDSNRPPRRPETNQRCQIADDGESDIESDSEGDDRHEVVSSKHKRNHRSTSRRKDVGFGTVTVREYARSVGDNPSVGTGTPIGLDWAYYKPSTMPVDYFEDYVRKVGHRTRQDFYLTEEQRFHLLLDEWGYSVEEIMDAKKVATHTRYLRQVSLIGEEQMAAMAAAERRASGISSERNDFVLQS